MSPAASAAATSPSAEPGEELARVEHELGAAALGFVVEADVVIEPDLNDRRGIHADADEQHIAEGVVAHLAADEIPGEREHDEQQKLGRLRLIGREQERRDDADGENRAEAQQPRRRQLLVPGA